MRKRIHPPNLLPALAEVKRAVLENADVMSQRHPGLRQEIAMNTYRILLHELNEKDFWVETHGPGVSDSAVAWSEAKQRWEPNHYHIGVIAWTEYTRFRLEWP